jgi:uncharacterized membrane protein
MAHPPQSPGTAHHLKIRDERVVLRRRFTRRQDRIADAMTAFSGSITFVYLHVGWFVLWLLINLGAVGSRFEFDPFPFGLLTLVVSLEAIFLSTFVLISQNRQAARADLRSELDYETNVRSEIWSRSIAEKLGVDLADVERRIATVVVADRLKLTEADSGRDGPPPG